GDVDRDQPGVVDPVPGERILGQRHEHVDRVAAQPGEVLGRVGDGQGGEVRLVYPTESRRRHRGGSCRTGRPPLRYTPARPPTTGRVGNRPHPAAGPRSAASARSAGCRTRTPRPRRRRSAPVRPTWPAPPSPPPTARTRPPRRGRVRAPRRGLRSRPRAPTAAG